MDELEDNLDYLGGELDEENENNCNPTELFILEGEVIENTNNREEQPLKPRQQYTPRKHLTRNRNFHDIDPFFNETNFEMIIYLNREGNFEEYVEYLSPKNDKKNKIIFWTSEQLVTTGRQRRCDTITGRTSCLVSNTKHQILKTEKTPTFHLFSDDNIINKIGDHTNKRINETITRLQRVESYDKSIDKSTWVKVTNKIELDALLRLIYFRGLFVVNLHLADRLFSPDSHFAFISIMSKSHFQFLRSHFCFDNAEERLED